MYDVHHIFRVRISSKRTYNHGLFIADFFAMPHGCSVWPAYWSVGPNWPSAGIFYSHPLTRFCSESVVKAKLISSRVCTKVQTINTLSIPVKAAKSRTASAVVKSPAISYIRFARQAATITAAAVFPTQIPIHMVTSSTSSLEASLLISGTALVSRSGDSRGTSSLQTSS